MKEAERIILLRSKFLSLLTSLYTIAFLSGLLGSIHCIGMCGPLLITMPFNRFAGVQKFFSILSYQVGRILVYMLMGAIVGVIGKGLAILGFAQWLSILAGIALLLSIRINWKLVFPNWLIVVFGKLLQPKFSWQFFGLGLVNGLLPCGMVYAALTIAIVDGTASSGALIMGLFGLGTLPLLILVLVGWNLNRFSFRKIVEKRFVAIKILIGAMLIVRGLSLGIPYISPKIPANIKSKTTIACMKP
ncbi:MAG: hypothetical protein RL596_644 [Bacteroidota bacterium]